MIKRILTRFSLLVLILVMGANGLIFSSPALAKAVDPPAGSGVRILQADAQGLTLEINLPSLEYESKVSTTGTCHALRLPGWGQSGESGQPGVPFLGVLIGIPLDAAPTVKVLDDGEAVSQVDLDLCPVPTLDGSIGLDGKDLGKGEHLVVETRAYAENRNYPLSQVEVGGTSFLRSQRIAQVRLQPFQYNPVARKLHSVAQLRVRVQFNSTLTQTQTVDEGPYEGILQNTLANYEQARGWRSLPAETTAPQANLAPDGQPAYKLAVSRDGLYRVTYADLSTAGLPVDTLDPRTFHLSNQGNEVALYVSGEADGVFNPADTVLFYGQKNKTKFTDTNIYWLTWGGSTGLRTALSDSAPTGASSPVTYLSDQHFEQNGVYLPSYSSGADQDHWYWDYIQAAGTLASKSFVIDLPHVSTFVPPTSPVQVRGLFKGYAASPQHHTRVYFNDHLIKDETWASLAEYTFNVTIPQSYLMEGSNTIKVECPSDGGITQDLVLVNWFKVDYQRDYAADGDTARFSVDTAGDWDFRVTGFTGQAAEVWDITQPLTPLRITNPVYEPTTQGWTLVFHQAAQAHQTYIAAVPGQLLAPDAITLDDPSDLRAETNGADYIIISHPDFLTAVQPLVAYHAEQGMRVQLVNVQDIYDEFNGGVFDPQAIRDFLAYAYGHWLRPAPNYVLLVGDGNYDFKNYRGLGEINYIPPFLAEADPWMGEVAADNRFVAFNPSDWLPVMALGRLPVKTSAEGAGMVQKILNYGENAAGGWTRKALVVSDNADEAGNFPASSGVTAAQLSADYTVDQITLPPGATEFERSVLRQSIQAAFNGGRALVQYNGHSTPYQWAYENLFSTEDVPLLANPDRLPFVVSMTCLVGDYILPSSDSFNYSSLDETLTRAPNGGAIASFSPTGKGLSSGHDVLAQGLYQALLSANRPDLGRATTQAKVYLYANSTANRELIDTYLLFGDPALQLPTSPTSVNLVSYSYALLHPAGIQLNWETVMDTHTHGFNLYRSLHTWGPYEKITSALIPVNNPASPTGSRYTYSDWSAQPGVSYSYKLEHVDLADNTSDWGVLTVQFRNTFLPITLR
jgi:hypothetical protein